MTLYTVQKISQDGKLYGKIHASEGGNYTECGVVLDGHWFILNNTRDGKVTCKKCLSGTKLY